MAILPVSPYDDYLLEYPASDKKVYSEGIGGGGVEWGFMSTIPT